MTLIYDSLFVTLEQSLYLTFIQYYILFQTKTFAPLNTKNENRTCFYMFSSYSQINLIFVRSLIISPNLPLFNWTMPIYNTFKKS